MYICIYVYMYICIYGTSAIHAPLHRLCTGPHAIFCAEKSALHFPCGVTFKDQRLACREIRIRPKRQRQHRTVPVEATGKLITLHSLGLFPPLGPKSLGIRLKLSVAMMAVSSRLRHRLRSQRQLSGGLIDPYGISHLLT